MKATFNARDIFGGRPLAPVIEPGWFSNVRGRSDDPSGELSEFYEKERCSCSRRIFCFVIASCRMMAHTNRWIFLFQNSMQDISGEVETKNDISLVLRLKVWLSFHHQRGTESSKSSCIFHAHTPCSAFLFVEEYFSHFFSSCGWSFKSRDLIPLF